MYILHNNWVNKQDDTETIFMMNGKIYKNVQ
jgi:hypothetical protein